MNGTTRQTFVACIAGLLLIPLAGLHASDAPQKSLPLSGEVFLVDGRTAFVILPEAKPASRPIPWVWYAPTLPNLPGDVEKWMFERFTRAGIAIAGIDVGESYGSPDGRALYTAFYEALTTNRGFAAKPVMLGRSRGGLMTLSWAVENADKVAGFAGIYPVSNVASYPGVAKASGAYGMAAEELATRLAEHNPIDRLAALAKAGVPLFAIHGDSDKVVPLEANSGEMRKRYEALGGKMQLVVPPGQGHNMWAGFFQCRELVDFVIAQVNRTNPTRGQPAKGEPTNAKEAAAQKAAADEKLDEEYAALVAKLPPDQQVWERVLQENLGGFYLPIHKRDKVAGRSNAWDFVRDDPNLPRVLLIGDSVSRGYTQAVRKALAGKANVHRAPANCGPTATGVRKIDVWLGDGKWDLIHFNFGIHDRATPVADYTRRVEQLVERMKKTGAKLVWASTTPIPDDPGKKQTAASIIERNQAAAEVMKKHGVAINDLFTFITPHLSTVQNANDVHFSAQGYDLLGRQIAAAIEAALK
ncbi:MAG TPA: GDSL-type esterase/lipase family protein [Thermoguttaceae bacterium]|nr:GDSL-type esterase/lipase family protein [Thermoguttaceae bacterium]